MYCPLCLKEGRPIFKGKLLQKHLVQYYQCRNCGLVYTEPPYWLDEAYSESITRIDTGIMRRNVDYAMITNVIIQKYFNRDASFLDFGGGYGIFTRMMRDLGYDWKWQDKFSPNLLAGGFEYTDKVGRVELISAFELFEHFSKPLEEIEHLFTKSDSILVSTLLYDDKLKFRPFGSWWYYVPQTGQHIAFYSKQTMEYIAQKFETRYYQINDELHLFTNKEIDMKELNRLINSKYAWIIQAIYYRKNRQRSLVLMDNQRMIKLYKSRGKGEKDG